MTSGRDLDQLWGSALDAVERMYGARSSWVLLRRDFNEYCVAMVCAAAKIEDLHFHDLRREFACRLLESRAELHDVP